MTNPTRYGPHRDEDAPLTVRVLPRGKWPRPVLVPVSPAILRQRRQINDVAVFGYVRPRRNPGTQCDTPGAVTKPART